MVTHLVTRVLRDVGREGVGEARGVARGVARARGRPRRVVAARAARAGAVVPAHQHAGLPSADQGEVAQTSVGFFQREVPNLQ